MPMPLTDWRKIPSFTTACAYERVFGSRALTALRAYGLEDPRARFYLLEEDGFPAAALYLADGVLTVSAREGAETAPIAALAREAEIREIHGPLPVCLALRETLGGQLDSSCFMVYRGGPVEGDFPHIVPGDLPTVFDILQRSHDYYRQHLVFHRWSADLEQRLSRGLSELYLLMYDGQAVGSGSIVSGDDTCGVVGTVAVAPEWRHRGLGSHISRFLTKRVLETGRVPRLMAGYDEVAGLYRQVGYEACGQWGELYL